MKQRRPSLKTNLVHFIMTSKSHNRPLKKINRRPKAVTPRQLAFVAQQKKDLRQTGRSIAILGLQEPTDASYPSVRPSHSTSYQDQVLNNDIDTGCDDIDFDNNPMNSNGLLEVEDDEDDWVNCEVDVEEEIVSGLERLQYDAQRLNREARWSHQCNLIIPTFLRCRQVTSNWGNPRNWNNDWKSPCSCPEYRRRDCWVDLVDLLSQFYCYKFNFLTI